MKQPPKLTDEQRQALDEEQGPVYLVDVNSNDQYVLLKADDYRHFQALFESDEFDISETYGGQEQAVKAVWDDPELDEYDK